MPATNTSSQHTNEIAIFAAGCFWGVQAYFDQVPGVVESEVGYIGGQTSDPTYEMVCSHTTGHAEAVKLTYNPEKVGYEALLKHFFRLHDPTQLNRQGLDIGDNYRSAIFYTSDDQKDAAITIINKLSETKQFSDPIVTQVEPATTFYAAETYHQKYFEKTGYGACHVPYQPVS